MNKLKTLFAAACAFVACSVLATPQWSAKCYKSSDADKPALSSGSLLGQSGVTFEFKDNTGVEESFLDDPSCLYNGTLDYKIEKGKSFGIAKYAKMNITFPNAAAITAIRFFSYHKDGGRDGIQIGDGAVKVKRTADGDWEELNVSQYSIALNCGGDTEDRKDGYYNARNDSGGCCYLALTDTTGVLADGVFGLRIEFGYLDNNSTNFDEIEVCGSLTRGGQAKLNRVNSSYVVDAKLDAASMAPADIILKKTDSDGTETQATLATGVTSGDWASYPITGLDATKAYQVKVVFASSSLSFEHDLGSICPSEVSLSAATALAVKVSRGDDEASIAYPLAVNLAFSGEAEKDVDFSAASSVTIPAGESSVLAKVTPLYNPDVTADRSLVIGLASGGYAAASTTVPLTLRKEWLLTPKKVLSVNFGTSNTGVSTLTTPLGILDVKGTLWNDVLDGSSKSVSTLKVWDGKSSELPETASSVSLAFSCRDSYAPKDSSSNPLLKGYLDEDGSTAVQITLKNLKSEFSNYALILYYATDQEKGWNAPVVNGVSYTAASDGTTTRGSDSWGSAYTSGSLNSETKKGLNVIRIDGLWADELTINAGKNTDWTRGTVTALQIVPSTGLTIESSTYAKYGPVTPDYGAVNALDFGDVVQCSATTEQEGATFKGWKLYTNAVDSAERLLWREGTESALMYEHNGCNAYLVWQWEEEDPPTPATWTYNSSTGVLTTESGWEFDTDGKADGMTVTALKTVGTSGTLDFSGTPPAGAPAIVAFKESLLWYEGSKEGGKLEELILPDTVLTIGHSAFRACANLKSVRFPEGIQDVGNCGFMDCEKLTTVTPFLPTSVTDVNSTFYNCSSLTGELVITSKDLKEIKANRVGNKFYGAFFNTKITLADLSESGVTNIYPFSFQAATELKCVKFPEVLEGIDNAAFYQCHSLIDVSFKSFPTVYGPSIFGDTPNAGNDPIAYGGRSRITYPADNVKWLSMVQGFNPVLWADASENMKNAYLAAHSDGLVPTGYANYKPPEPKEDNFTYTKWYVPVPVEVTETRLGIQGVPVQCGAVSPGYGDCGVIETFPVNCTAPQYTVYEDALYECLGYKLGKLVGTEVEYGEIVPELELKFNPSEVGSYYVQWQWKKAAYPIALKAGTGVDIVVDAEPYKGNTGYYTEGVPVTVYATGPKGEKPVRWYVDGTAGHDGEETIQVTPSKKMDVQVYIALDWTYENNVLTDGYWTFNASGDASAITIGALTERKTDTVDILDFRKTVHAGQATGTLVAMAKNSCNKTAADTVRELYFSESVTDIGEDAFSGRTKLKTMVLSQGLKSIGKNAFSGCSSLKTVTPFLPANVTLGVGAFHNASSLTGKLILKTTEEMILPGEGENGLFQGTQITSVDLTDSKITSLGKNCFRDCSNLGDVFLPKSLDDLGSAVFHNSGNLTNLVFRSFPTTWYVDDTFGNDSGYRRRIVYPAGNAGWAKYIADRSSSFVAWADAEEDKQNTYIKSFGKKPLPIGYLQHMQGTAHGDTRLWMVPKNESSFVITIR